MYSYATDHSSDFLVLMSGLSFFLFFLYLCKGYTSPFASRKFICCDLLVVLVGLLE